MQYSGTNQGTYKYVYSLNGGAGIEKNYNDGKLNGSGH